jgi:hypothetical protein
MPGKMFLPKRTFTHGFILFSKISILEYFPRQLLTIVGLGQLDKMDKTYAFFLKFRNVVSLSVQNGNFDHKLNGITNSVRLVKIYSTCIPKTGSFDFFSKFERIFWKLQNISTSWKFQKRPLRPLWQYYFEVIFLKIDIPNHRLPSRLHRKSWVICLITNLRLSQYPRAIEFTWGNIWRGFLIQKTQFRKDK